MKIDKALKREKKNFDAQYKMGVDGKSVFLLLKVSAKPRKPKKNKKKSRR